MYSMIIAGNTAVVKIEAIEHAPYIQVQRIVSNLLFSLCVLVPTFGLLVLLGAQ